MSSLDEPPLSLIGITYVNEHEFFSITSLNTSTRLLAALPPEKTTSLRLDGDADGLFSTFHVGRSDMIEELEEQQKEMGINWKKAVPGGGRVYILQR